MSQEHVTLVNDQNYTSFLEASAAVVVFGIVPCAQCESYDPIFREVAAQFDGSVKFGKAKLHVPGACREIKRRHRFSSFPTTHFYKKGSLVHVIEGRVESPQLDQMIRQVIFNSTHE